ncbi:hypothetical protein ZIOFF_056361 [Zingiber officinale]|uniref:dUTPase-like domain-containing protein n=1 Tax=Zingiber officinale TaxID=94328 RepID=A0A8J5KQF6_ZINOF|nr:hypothetical protein ZIOFF_056361 [Zingiber officinale]
MHGRISLSFYNYTVARPSIPLVYNQKDEDFQNDDDTPHTIAVLIESAPGTLVYQDNDESWYYEEPAEGTSISNEYPFILVRKLNPNVVIPIQRTPSAAGFDLATSEARAIEPRGRNLVPTGLSLEIP